MFIVSFATPKYEIEAYKLLDDLRSQNIPHEVHFIEGLGLWQKNNLYKPVFIKEMLLKHKKAVVWLDADTEIRQYPELFDKIDCDVAVNFFKGEQLCGGVIYFNYTPAAIEILDAWIENNRKFPDEWDQANLQDILPLFPNLRLHKLPREYCTFDLCEDQSNPVLWSRQASRRLRESLTQ